MQTNNIQKENIQEKNIQKENIQRNAMQANLPIELVEAITDKLPLETLPTAAAVCRIMRARALYQMTMNVSEILEKQYGSKNLTKYMVEGMLDSQRTIAAFRKHLPNACSLCQCSWSVPYLRDVRLCASCVRSEDYIPFRRIMASEDWVPKQEMMVRGLIRVSDHAGQDLYAKLRQKGWPKSMPYQFVRKTDVEQVSNELFGRSDIGKAARKKINAIHERGHHAAKASRWRDIVCAGPHVQTTLDYLEDGTKSWNPTAFITSVNLSYSSLNWDGIQDYAQKCYGNTIIPGMLRWTGDPLTTHISYTRFVCKMVCNKLSR
jgi:hypothetical protein